MKKGILMIHGFTGLTSDFDFLKGHIPKEFIIEKPFLRGHEHFKLGSVTCENWIEDSLAAYDRLAEKVDEITCIAHSMGNILVHHILKERPHNKVKKVIMLNPAFKHTNFTRVLLDGPFVAFEFFVTLTKGHVKRALSRMFTPKKAIRQLYKLSRNSVDLLQYNHVDNLIFLGTRDGLVRPKMLKYVYSIMPTKKKRLVVLKYGHMPNCASKKVKAAICKEVRNFILD